MQEQRLASRLLLPLNDAFRSTCERFKLVDIFASLVNKNASCCYLLIPLLLCLSCVLCSCAGVEETGEWYKGAV